MAPRERRYTVQGAACHVADYASNVAVIVAHPWGPLGGNLHNNVVLATVLYFQRLGITTVRFDFSGSQIGRGYAQVEQVKHVANKLLQGDFVSTESTRKTTAPAPKHLILIGYSYGSLITTTASAEIPATIATVSISPPFGVQSWLLFFHSKYHLEQAAEDQCNVPRLFILGDEDNFSSEATLASILRDYFPSATAAILREADHFWRRREKDVLTVVGQWLLVAFPQCQSHLSSLRDLDFGLSTTEASTP
jgi:alpha/beta superfamily hydrolase